MIFQILGFLAMIAIGSYLIGALIVAEFLYMGFSGKHAPFEMYLLAAIGVALLWFAGANCPFSISFI